MAEIFRFPGAPRAFAPTPARRGTARRPWGAFVLATLRSLAPGDQILRPEELSEHLRRDMGLDTPRDPRPTLPF